MRFFTPILFAAALVQSAAALDFTYTYLGCFQDSSSNRVLGADYVQDQPAQTVEKCVAYCGANGYNIAGLEGGTQCFCSTGSGYASLGQLTSSSCPQTCSGNNAQECGGFYTASVYKIKTTATYIGCYKDQLNTRAMTNYLLDSQQHQTVEKCVAFCARQGFAYAGLQFSVDCYCGNEYAKYGSYPESSCQNTCSGDSTEKCGGSLANSVYQIQTSATGGDSNVQVLYQPCPTSVQQTAPAGYTYMCISISNLGQSTLKHLAVRIRSTFALGAVSGLGGAVTEQDGSVTYTVSLNGGLPKQATSTSTSTFLYKTGTAATVQILAYSF